MEHGGAHAIGSHKLLEFAGITLHIDTLYMTWIAMGIIIVISIVATRRIKLIPTGWQNMLEIVIEALMEQLEATVGPKGKKLAPLIITLFLFLLVSNWLGLVPGFTSPTNDINTALGLALMVIILVHILGAVNQGLFPYIKHFFKPHFVFLPINIIEEVSKPITLSFRLFGNILAGEILIIVLGMLVPYVIPTAWLAFSVFVGLVQALVFTILTLAYLGNSFKEENH